MKGQFLDDLSFSLSCCSRFEHKASVKRFVSFEFLNLRQSVGHLGRGISPSQDRYLTQTDIYALSGIRTHDPSVLASEDSSCFRPCGHCDRLMHDGRWEKIYKKKGNNWSRRLFWLSMLTGMISTEAMLQSPRLARFAVWAIHPDKTSHLQSIFPKTFLNIGACQTILYMK
jgi:hypothetical protein